MPLNFVLRFLFTLPKLAFEDGRAPSMDTRARNDRNRRTRTAGLGRKLILTEGFSISNQKKMDVSNDMERRQKFERNVKDYLEAMDKIQLDIVKMLEESMKLNEILQDAVSQRAEQYLEQDNQRQPKNSSQKDQ